MFIRMTTLGTPIIALLAAGAATAGGLAGGADSGEPADPAPRTALVIDAAEARDGRDLLDPRLEKVDAEVRLPRTRAEAQTNIRYFADQGYRLVVTGPRATAAADATGVAATSVPSLTGALAATGR
jgi:hypothetical protein